MTNIFGKLKTYFFSPRYHFSRFQFNLAALIFAVFGFLFATYFAAVKLPQVFALNDTTKTWTFNTANAGNYTYDTSLVTVDDTGGRPVTGVNKVINPAFSSDTSSWSLAAVAGSTTPAGWVVVPGNTTYSTTDFLAMKYEAKAWDTQTDTVVADGGYSLSDHWAGINSQTRYQARSVSAGKPWVRIAQEHVTNFDAKEACSALGSDYHLINNNEWMTVARNAANINSNWTNGTVGDGALFRGNSNSSASMDGSDPLTGINTRTLTLSNGSVIWDMAGNVWNWTDDIQSSAINTTGGWVEWNHANIATGARELYGPSSASYLSASGMGQVYGGALNNGFLRGGTWNYTSSAGAVTLNLSNTPGSSYNSIGFRCASDPVAISQSFSSDSGRAGGGNTITIGSYTDAKLTQSINVGDTSTYDFST